MSTPQPPPWLVRKDDPLLLKYLSGGRDNDLFYGQDMLSDHLPMAMTALRRLGASNLQLTGFRARYSVRLEPPRYPDRPLPGDPWADARGQLTAYPALRAYFDGELATRGRDAVLQEWLPRLIGSAGVDAFHPLIRTAFAVESRVDEELACGLAYWVAVWRDLPTSDGDRLDLSADEAFRKLQAETAFDQMSGWRGMFGDQLVLLASMPEFQSLVRWRGPQMDLQNLARASARIYLSTGLFFALHMVTGTQAVHQLSPWAGDTDAVADALWMNLAAAYLIIKRPVFAASSPPVQALPLRRDVLAAALKHHDEHMAKLAFSAAEEWSHWQQPEHAEILHRIARGKALLGF